MLTYFLSQEFQTLNNKQQIAGNEFALLSFWNVGLKYRLRGKCSRPTHGCAFLLSVQAEKEKPCLEPKAQSTHKNIYLHTVNVLPLLCQNALSVEENQGEIYNLLLLRSSKAFSNKE